MYYASDDAFEVWSPGCSPVPYWFHNGTWSRNWFLWSCIAFLWSNDVLVLSQTKTSIRNDPLSLTLACHTSQAGSSSWGLTLVISLSLSLHSSLTSSYTHIHISHFSFQFSPHRSWNRDNQLIRIKAPLFVQYWLFSYCFSCHSPGEKMSRMSDKERQRVRGVSQNWAPQAWLLGCPAENTEAASTALPSSSLLPLFQRLTSAGSVSKESQWWSEGRNFIFGILSSPWSR